MQSVAETLDRLESFYGPQQPGWPTEPYAFLVWWHCGYPASDAACDRGWRSLQQTVGVEPQQLLGAAPSALAAALKPGGMVPELRAMRLQQIAARVQDALDGDLRAALMGPLPAARKLLKQFPNIADPGADRMLLFARIAPITAVPSNCPHVLVRIEHGMERESYSVTYREAQEMLDAELPKTYDARMRAFLLLKQHGQELCKRIRPKCEECPLRNHCAYVAGHRCGRHRAPTWLLCQPRATCRYSGVKPRVRAWFSRRSNSSDMVAPAFCVTSSSMGRSKSSAP